MSVVMMTLVTVFVVTNVPRMLGMLHEVSCIPDILDCYDRGCQYHVTSLRWRNNTNYSWQRSFAQISQCPEGQGGACQT